MGVPVPGETMLVTAAIYAGATHQLSIQVVIAVAIVAAIVGDNAGFLIGRRLGYPLLERHGGRVGITPERLKLGRFLFRRHGGKVVFFGRFIAVLRALAALLAGVNCMSWGRFLLFNAAGGATWAGGYGTLAYIFGERLEPLAQPIRIVLMAAAVLGVVVGAWFVRSHEARLQAEADRALAE
jgi:membrane protein DedA with SNARE-associated domain